MNDPIFTVPDLDSLNNGGDDDNDDDSAPAFQLPGKGLYSFCGNVPSSEAREAWPSILEEPA